MQKLAELCIRRPVFATMLIMALVVMGVASYFRLGVDFFPKVEFPIVTVSTTLRGAAPEEVETQVSKRIEEAVNTIAGIDDLRSTSAEGISLVSIQFVLEKDPDVAAQEVRDKISTILSELPKDADPPVVQKLATDASPILNIVVASGRDLRETTKVVDDRIKKNIESLDGVGEVRFVGERQRQIQVWLDGEKLYSYNLNIDQVRAALAAQNVEIPGGRVDQGARELSLRTFGRVERPQDFERIIVANVGGSPVRISDIGRGGGRRRRAAVTGAPRWNARGRPGSSETVGHEHPPGHQQREGARGRTGSRSAARLQSQLHAGPVEVHPGFVQRRAGAPPARRYLRGHRRSAVHPELALDADRGGCHSDVHHLHVHPDEGDGFHAESDHNAGACTHGRHCDRRRDRRPREHLQVRRGEEAWAGAKRRYRALETSAWRSWRPRSASSSSSSRWR